MRFLTCESFARKTKISHTEVWLDVSITERECESNSARLDLFTPRDSKDDSDSTLQGL